MHHRRRQLGRGFTLICALLLASQSPLLACLCDRDEAALVEHGPPPVLQAILGEVPRHTKEYDRWRVDQLQDLGDAATAEQLDDLAVALFRLGQVGRATDTMHRKDERFSGRLSTWANLSAFAASQGKLDDAADYLERAAALAPDPPPAWLPCRLGELQFRLRAEEHDSALTSDTMLGRDPAAVLGLNFRVEAPTLQPDDDRRRGIVRAHVLDRLELDASVFDGLVELLVLCPDESAERYFALGELLAATGDRVLAWHAYQRAYDLRHPRDADLPFCQQQVLGGLPHEQRDALTPPTHWRARRRALDWVKAWQRHERDLLAAGRNPDDPAEWTTFDQEHPRP